MGKAKRTTETSISKVSFSRKLVSLGRHECGCKVCSHARREEIDHDFINWKSPALIAKEYGLKDRSSVYRHANALDLFSKRQRNVRAALERIIERAYEVEVNAAAVVSAVRTYASINSFGQWVERSEQVNLNELFERMTREELEAYARNATLPEWFTRTLGATAPHSPDPESDS
jgi:hypothetical protein